MVGSNKFSASLNNMGRSNRVSPKTQQNPQNKTIKFDHQMEDKIRDQARKVFYLASELQEENLLPDAHGLLMTNERIVKIFPDKAKDLDYAYLEISETKFLVDKNRLLQFLADNNIPVESQKEGTNSTGGKVIRLLIGIKNLK